MGNIYNAAMHYSASLPKRHQEFSPDSPQSMRQESSFFIPMRFMPKARRRGLAALYDFCRAVDDDIDKAELSTSELQEKLAFWRDEVAGLYEGAASHAVSQLLAQAVRDFSLPREGLKDMLRGWEMDASGQMVKPTLASLEDYRYCVAGAVGLLALRIFGCTHPDSAAFALHLGHGLQIINILRDIESDAQAGRIYLPRELLDRHGLSDLTCATLDISSQATHKVCEDMARLARHHLHAAESFLPREERRKLIPALLMRDIYAHYLDVLEQNDWQAPSSLMQLSLWRKAWVMWRGVKYRI